MELEHSSVFDCFVDGRFGVRKRKRVHERNLDDVDEFLEYKNLQKKLLKNRQIQIPPGFADGKTPSHSH